MQRGATAMAAAAAARTSWPSRPAEAPLTPGSSRSPRRSKHHESRTRNRGPARRPVHGAGASDGADLFPDLSEFRHSQPVFATGFMVGLMEAPCMAAIYPYLEPGEATVGTLINMTHLSAATPGTSLMAEARATAIHGQTVRFAVAVTDSARDVIAAGEHGLRVVEVARFHDRLEAKQAQLRRLGSSSLPCEQQRLGRQRPHLPAGIEDPPDRLGDLGDLGEHPPQDVLAALALVHRDVAGAGAAMTSTSSPVSAMATAMVASACCHVPPNRGGW